MLKPVFLATFSGHRPDGSLGRTADTLDATKDHLRQVFAGLQNTVAAVNGELHLVSGIAEGADIAACETARDMDIPIHFVLPKPPRELLDGLIAPWKPRAVLLLATAGQAPCDYPIETEEPLPPCDPRNTCRVGAISRTSPDCYAEANSLMLEVADVLVSVATTLPPNAVKIAGTHYLIRQAELLEKPRINVDPAASGDAISTHRINAFARATEENGEPETSIEIFHKLSPHIKPAGDDPSFSSIVDCLRGAAGKSSAAFRRSTATAILLHAIAGFFAAGVAAVYYALKTDPNDPHHTTAYWIFAIVALTELLLVGIAFFLEWLSGWRNEQHIWLNCRFARELMRGVEAANPFLDPLFPEIHRHHPRWERFATTCALLIRSETGPLDHSSQDAIRAARDAYLEKRIRHQIGHFKEKGEKASPKSHLVKGLAHFAGPVALLVVTIAFFAKADDLLFHGHHKPAILANDWGSALFLLFLPIFVPLLASLSSSFLAAFDFGRRTVRYREMEKSLQTAAHWLPTLQALPSIQSTVRRTEEILLDEQIEWLAAQKSGFGH